MHEHLSKRGKVAATFMAMLLVITLTATLLPEATATPTLTISIYPVSGTVGTEIEVNGIIDTLNGSYTIRWNGTLNVTTGYATGYNVTTSFVIPQTVGAPSGRDVLIELIDNNKTVDNVVNTTFKLYTKYYVEAVVPSPPSQLQEGQTTDIWVNVTGGEANTVYFANITVKELPPANLTYWTTVWLTNTTTTGSGNKIITYPSNFSAGAHTNYTGIYNIAFNETLASGNFTFGLTNATEYHRFQVVGIRATGYQANESVWINMTFAGENVISIQKNASANGVIETSWKIPWNASIGLYTVTVTNSTTPGTIKPVPDTQNFTVTEKIISISTYPTNGTWGTTVRVEGEIVKFGGSYQIRWDGEPIKSGNCISGSAVVNDTFIVPPSVKGYHNITLYDVNQTKESMPATFEVTTSCYVLAKPARILEGLPPAVTVGLREAKANVTYTFTINVTDPLNRTWSVNIFVTTTKDGSGENFTEYGGATDYLGTYSITVNETLATGSFTAGLTDELEYRRTKSVVIQGAGYNATRDVTINIKKDGVSVKGYPKNVTTFPEGVVTDLWTIPENATLGIYTVTLVNATTGKVKRPIPDSQNFTVIEIIIYCQARNKYDKEPLAGVSVEVFFEEMPITSGKTNTTGWVEFRLDRGNVTFRAFWKGARVGSLENQSITGNVTEYVLQKMFNVECELAHVTIVINDEADPPNPLPFITVTLTSDKTGPLQFETNYTGIIATNTFTNTSYTLEARRYGHLFNRTLIENLTFTRWINIACPTYTLFAHVLDSRRLPLQDVQVVAYEWGSQRVKGSETTNDWGSVAVSCTFGRYKIRVYDRESGILLKETVIDLIEDKSFLVIHCRISNVDFSVAVKDYFGHPIPNALVKVEREGVEIGSLKAGSNGTISLQGIIGGDYRISVYVMNKLFGVKTLYLDESKVIELKIDKLIVVGGYPLEVTQLVTYILLVIVVAVFALALIYRKFYPRKVQKEGKEKSL